MQKKLQEEEAGNHGGRTRGLKHNQLPSADARVQSFEIYLPKSLRERLAKARIRKPSDAELLAGAKKAGRRRADEDEEEEEEPPAEAASSATKGWTQKETAIREEEYRKNKISDLLRDKLGDALQSEQIKASSFWTRWARAPPEGVDIGSAAKPYVVQDLHEDSPGFARMMYRDMDRPMLDLYIMLFTAFDEWLDKNSLLAIFLVYCVELVYQTIRRRLSVQTLSKKAYVDDRFLS